MDVKEHQGWEIRRLCGRMESYRCQPLLQQAQSWLVSTRSPDLPFICLSHMPFKTNRLLFGFSTSQRLNSSDPQLQRRACFIRLPSTENRFTGYRHRHADI
jgi:hypothetical protein